MITLLLSALLGQTIMVEPILPSENYVNIYVYSDMYHANCMLKQIFNETDADIWMGIVDPTKYPINLGVYRREDLLSKLEQWDEAGLIDNIVLGKPEIQYLVSFQMEYGWPED